MPHDIFISYSRRDLAVLKPIKEKLESLGFSCWMDLEGIESGSEEFTEKIADAIEGSTVFLFFLSATSQESRWALNELRLARKLEKRVVLVGFNDDQMRPKFMLELGGSDIIDWRVPEQREKLLRDLREWTGVRRARCSKARLEKALRARGDWDAAVAFMKENDIFLDYSAANRIDEENELVQKAIRWLKEARGYSDEQLSSLLAEAAVPRKFTPLKIITALRNRGLLEAAQARLAEKGLMGLLEHGGEFDEDDPHFAPSVEWLRSVGADVDAILSEAEIKPQS